MIGKKGPMEERDRCERASSLSTRESLQERCGDQATFNKRDKMQGNRTPAVGRSSHPRMMSMLVARARTDGSNGIMLSHGKRTFGSIDTSVYDFLLRHLKCMRRSGARRLNFS